MSVKLGTGPRRVVGNVQKERAGRPWLGARIPARGDTFLPVQLVERRVGGHETIAEPGRPPGRGARGATHEDGQSTRLNRYREYPHRAPPPLDRLTGPRPAEQGDARFERGPPGREVGTEHVELAPPVARSHHHLRPPLADDVDDREFLGDSQRVVQRQDEGGHAQPQPAGPGSKGGQRSQRRGAVAVGAAVVFGDPYVLKAVAVRPLGHVDRSAVEHIWPRTEVRCAQVEPESELRQTPVHRIVGAVVWAATRSIWAVSNTGPSACRGAPRTRVLTRSSAPVPDAVTKTSVPSLPPKQQFVGRDPAPVASVPSQVPSGASRKRQSAEVPGSHNRPSSSTANPSGMPAGSFASTWGGPRPGWGQRIRRTRRAAVSVT